MGKIKHPGKSSKGSAKGLLGKKSLQANGNSPKIRLGKVKSKTKLMLTDKIEYQHVTGIPDELQLEQKMGILNPEDRKVFTQIKELLSSHLGSTAAARLWLVSSSPGFKSYPLDLVRQGQAKQLLAMLESQWGPNPTYA